MLYQNKSFRLLDPGNGNLPVRLATVVYLSCLLILLSYNSHAWQSLTTNLDIHCSQTDSQLLACSYRLLATENPSTIIAMINGQPLDIITDNIYPAEDAVTAILLLVDTSDPGRQAVISENIRQIEQIISYAQPHHRIGLASFDTELDVLAAPGSPADTIISNARSLTAAGITTELYLNTIRAIELLAKTNADRKVVLLFSDGQAEDTAYFHQDATNAARRHGVIINTIGFPRSRTLSVALQSLRRLSEETGGRFVATDSSFSLNDAFLQAPFENIDRGGKFVIDLNTIENNNRTNPFVVVSFLGAEDDISVAIPVNLPAPLAANSLQIPAPITIAPAAPQESLVQPQTTESAKLELWLWYGVPSILVSLVILSIVALLLLSYQQRSVNIVGSARQHSSDDRAYLVSQDHDARPYLVTRDSCRIGRSRDNEMYINDNSVSRRHAEIQRDKNGKYVLYDRNSTNGVYVNKKKISTHRLREGDVIEIGDIYFRFTQNPSHYRVVKNPGQSTARIAAV